MSTDRAPGLAAAIVLIAFPWLAPAALHAQATPIGDQFQVNDFTTGTQSEPSVVLRQDGDFIVVWSNDGSRPQDPDPPSISMRHFGANGGSVGPEEVINTNTLGSQGGPFVTSRPDGATLLLWDGAIPGGELSDIAAEPRGADLDPVPEVRANAYTLSTQSSPRAVALPNGEFAVVWRSNGSFDDDDDSASIQVRRLDSSGIPYGADVQVNEWTTGAQLSPAIAAHEGGEVLVVWASDGSSGTDSDSSSVQGRLLSSSSGLPIGAELQVNVATARDQKDPAVAALPDGRFVVVWSSVVLPGAGLGRAGQAASSRVRARFVAADGTPTGDEITVRTGTDARQDLPAVTAHDDGDFVVAWRHSDSLYDYHGDEVFAQRFASDGGKRGSEFLVNSLTSPDAGDDLARPQLDSANDTFVVVWDSEEPLDNDGDNGVEAKRFFATEWGLRQPGGIGGIGGRQSDDLLLFEPEKLNRLIVNGRYSGADVAPADDFVVRIYEDDSGSPATSPLYEEIGVDSSRVPIGSSMVRFEHSLTLADPVPLSPGRYWIEVSTQVEFGEANKEWEWVVTTHEDPVNGSLGALNWDAEGMFWHGIPLDMGLTVPYRELDGANADLLWHQGLWHQGTRKRQRFRTTSENIALADEIGGSTTPANTFLGYTLTYPTANTGLARGFEVTALQVLQGNGGWTWNDQKLPGGDRALSPNDVDNGQDDDFEIIITSGPPLTAFAMTIVHNQDPGPAGPFEVLEIYDLLGMPLATFDLVRVSFAPNHTFLGVLSEKPIGRIVFDEDAIGDDIGVQDFIFARATLPIFLDGFESGDTTAWSTTQP